MEGSAIEALTQASKDNDVVVVGSRGRGGFTGLIFGSVSQGLIQHAVGPVYVVPRKYVESAKSESEEGIAQTAENVPEVPLESVKGIQEVSISQADDNTAKGLSDIIDPPDRP